jgi:hypothetical protein
VKTNSSASSRAQRSKKPAASFAVTDGRTAAGSIIVLNDGFQTIDTLKAAVRALPGE